MEITNIIKMNKLPFFVLLLCLFTNCSKDSDATDQGTTYNYFYPVNEATIRTSDIPGATQELDPKGITVADGKLYICNGDVLEIFNATTLKHITTITHFTKGSTTIPLSKLSSVSVDNGRIYLGSVDSRLFVFDQATNAGISTVGNGQWWQTFVHVFGVVVSDGLVFVKEKNSTIKIFQTSQISQTSNWNLTPFAMLSTLNGYDEIYSMDVAEGSLVVAGRNAKNFLYYDIAAIRAAAARSIENPILPTTSALTDIKPIAVYFGGDWAISSENTANLNYLRLYPKQEFLGKKYSPVINTADIMGEGTFGSIVSIAQAGDRIFLSDNTNKRIRIIRLNKTDIVEQD